MALTPEYEEMISQYLKKAQGRKSEAESGAIGESIRRGGAGSNIEFGLRQKAVQPHEEATAGALAGFYGQAAEKDRQERMIKEGQQYQTGERMGSQQFAGQESQYGRELQKYMQQEKFKGAGYVDPTTGKWLTEETPGGKRWGGALDRYRGNVWNMRMADKMKPKKKKWYESMLPGIAQGGATAGTMWGLSKLK